MLVVLLVVLVGALPGSAFAGAFGAPVAPQLAAPVLPPEFSESVVWSGLGNPTVIRFADDGRVFVATKAGVIYEFDSVDDPTPTVFANLSAEVHDFWDRGLLGMALDPKFTSGRPYVYVLYSHDKQPWGDTCPADPGATDDGCVIDGRLSRLDADGHEEVLLTDFCQQYPSHSVGTLAFGPDGMLYASAGEGAHFDFPDFGQVSHNHPANPCGDPPDAVPNATTSEAGALRAQSFRRPPGEPVTLDGTIIRLDPDTLAAAPGNPAANDADANRRRIIAYGFRNPFRFTFRPGTGEIWSADVGWEDWEELNRIPDLTKVRNYGWPCYEGPAPQGAYQALGNASCQALYDADDTVKPFYAYRHDEPVVDGDNCSGDGSSLTALQFYEGDAFPAAYRGALFFGDYSRDCIWVMYPGADGTPDPSTRELFEGGAQGPVFLTEGPDGALYYADLNGGTVRRIAFKAPQAVIAATPASGLAPLTVHFDASGSTGDALTYAWDLDGDGAYDDSTDAQPQFTYTAAGSYTVGLRVSDGVQSVTTTKTITVGAPPTVAISAPAPTTTWAVGDTIAFAGSAHDGTGAPLPASALQWTLILRHCSRTDASACHTHTVERFDGVSSGSFVAPDHEYPSHLELTVTATDGDGLSDSKTVSLYPRTTDITLTSDPSGLMLSLGSDVAATPFTRTVIARGTTVVGVPAPPSPYAWRAWSDGLQRTHTITAPDGGTVTLHASFDGAPLAATATPAPTPSPSPAPPQVTPTPTPTPSPPVGAWGFDEGSGTSARDSSGHGDAGKLTGALRVKGRFGNALDFDGSDDWVTLRPPRLTRALTVEAWVYPTRRGGSLALAETKRGAAWSLYGDQAGVGAHLVSGKPPPLRRWTHLALTYDGTTVRRYVNGVLTGARRQSGAIARSTYPLRLGGNAVWPEWFRGRLDELRIYDRALTSGELGADMATPIDAKPQPLKPAKRTRTGARVTRYRGGSRAHR